MKMGMNHPMGPLELADFIGLDVCVDILDVLYKGFGDPKYRACSAACGSWSRRDGWGASRAADFTPTQSLEFYEEEQ